MTQPKQIVNNENILISIINYLKSLSFRLRHHPCGVVLCSTKPKNRYLYCVGISNIKIKYKQ